MVLITGDIHCTSVGFKEQSFSKYSEFELAIKYAEIAKKYDLKVTLFVTGKASKQEKDIIRKLSEFKNVEIGGHTYYGLQPQGLHEKFQRYFGTYYGPFWVQMLDILLTRFMLKNITGFTINSWRTHAYRSDFRTYKILRMAGIDVISDEVNQKILKPYENNFGLVTLPINTCPDHEHIYHGYRTKEFVRNIVHGKWKWKDDFGSESYTIEQWSDIVDKGVIEIVRRGGIATILAHPLCMEVSDSMNTFDRLCSHLSIYKSYFAQECVNLCQN